MNKFERIKKKTFNASKACLRAAKFMAENGYITVSQEEYEERVEICENCPMFEKYSSNECGECLCYIKGSIEFSKAWLASEYCPLFKWKGDYLKAPEPE